MQFDDQGTGASQCFQPKLSHRLLLAGIATLGAALVLHGFFLAPHDSSRIAEFALGAACVLALTTWPRLIVLDEAGLSYPKWLGRNLQMRWEEMQTYGHHWNRGGKGPSSITYAIRAQNGRRIVWSDLTHDGKAILDAIQQRVNLPSETVTIKK